MFKQIKKWLETTGGKYIIVENSKPKYIIMKVEDFEALLNSCPDAEINKEILAIKEEENQAVDISLDKQN
ncbi:MAG: hypothetical protein ABIG90_02215 [bacterium]